MSLHRLGMPSVATPLLRSLLDCATGNLTRSERAVVLDEVDEAEAGASDMVHGRAVLGDRPARWHYLRVTGGHEEDEASADFERAGRELELGRADVAGSLLDDVLDEDVRALGPSHPAVAHTMVAAGAVRALDGDCEEALDHMDRARQVLTAGLGAGVARRSLLRMRIDAVRGHCLTQLGQLQDAEELLEAAAQASKKALGKQHPMHALLLSELGQTRLQLAQHRLKPLCGVKSGGGKAQPKQGSGQGGGRGRRRRGRAGAARGRPGRRTSEQNASEQQSRGGEGEGGSGGAHRGTSHGGARDGPPRFQHGKTMSAAACRSHQLRLAAKAALPSMTTALRRWRQVDSFERREDYHRAKQAHEVARFRAYSQGKLSPLESAMLDLTLDRAEQWTAQGRTLFSAFVEAVLAAKGTEGDFEGAVRYGEQALASAMVRVTSGSVLRGDLPEAPPQMELVTLPGGG